MSDELPDGWTSARFEQVLVDSQNGCSARSGQGRPTVVLRLADITTDGVVAQNGLREIPLNDDAREKYALVPGDLLAFRVNGSPGICGQVIRYPGPQGYAYCDHFIRLRVNHAIVAAAFAALAFKTSEVRSEVERQMVSSAGQNTVSQATLRALRLPIAPLPEQHRIVEKVEALLEQVNRAKERLDRVPRILKRFRQAVLAAACSGELTPESDADAWEELTIESVAFVGTGSTPLRTNPAFYSRNGTPWITSAATSRPFVTQAEECVTDQAVRTHRLKKYPIGTLLVAMYGEGKTRGQVSELAIEATINQAMAAIVVDSRRAKREFVKLHLQGNYLQMRSLSEGGNQPNLNLSKIKEFPLRLPAPQIQALIVARVEALMVLADTIERRVQAATARANKLPQAILSKAFSGELVPTEAELARLEGRTYETAEELLKRVTALGSDAPAAGKGRGRRARKAE